MDYDSAVKQASRVKSYYPYRIVGVYTKDGEEWEVISGKTKARLNSLAKKGYSVNEVK